MFYSLFIALYARHFRISGLEEEVTGSIDIEKTQLKIEEFCIQFSQQNYDPATKAKFKQATGNLGQRLFRHEEISKLVA